MIVVSVIVISTRKGPNAHKILALAICVQETGNGSVTPLPCSHHMMAL